MAPSIFTGPVEAQNNGSDIGSKWHRLELDLHTKRLLLGLILLYSYFMLYYIYNLYDASNFYVKKMNYDALQLKKDILKFCSF